MHIQNISTSASQTDKKPSTEQLQSDARKKGTYYVSKGETLYNIAKKFNMNPEEFKKLTGLKSNSLSIGQTISNIPAVTIKSGQGLSSIAKANGMTLNQFLELNNINSKYIPQAGEKFYIYPKSNETTPAKTQETKPTVKQETPAVKQTPQTPQSNSTEGKTKITLDNGKTFTAKQLQESAVNSGKNSPELRGCKNPYIFRPLPNINNNKIEATCEIQKPTNKNGQLKGKVIILNPGHGGYQQKNGFFDPGTICTTKNAKGDLMPVEEWRVTKDYTDSLAIKLRAKGATVVIVQGAVQNGGMYSQHYLEGLINGKKGSDDVKKLMKNTRKSDMLFISTHIEAKKERPHDKGCSVIMQNDDLGDKKLAENIQKAVQKGFSTLKPQIVERNLYVTKAMGTNIPAVLLEVGNIANKDIQASLLSNHDQNKYMDCIANAIEATLNPPKPKK